MLKNKVELHYTIHQENFSTEISKFFENKQEANCSCGFGVKGGLKESDNKENSSYSGGISEQLILCVEKRRMVSPYNQSKNVERVCFFSF